MVQKALWEFEEKQALQRMEILCEGRRAEIVKFLKASLQYVVDMQSKGLTDLIVS